MMTIAPRMVGDYPFKTDDASELVSLLDGNIGENLKKMLLDFYPETIAQLFSDPEESRLEAIAGYANLQRTLRQIQSDEAIFSFIKQDYGTVVHANLCFALKVMETLIPPLLMSVNQSTTIEYQPSEEELEEITNQLRLFVSESREFPDTTDLKEIGGQDLLMELVMAFNIGLLILLVFLVVNIAKSGRDLSKSQISEIETLLRDWPQEVMAQVTLLSTRPEISSKIELVGIEADKEDLEISEAFSKQLSTE